MHWTNLSPRRLDRDKGPDNSPILSSQYGPPNHRHVPRQTGSSCVSYVQQPGPPDYRPLRRTPSHPPDLSGQSGPSDQHGVPRQTGFPDVRCPPPNAFNSRSLSRTPVNQHGPDYEGWGLPVQHHSNSRDCDARYLYGARHQYGPDPLIYPGYGYQTYRSPPFGHYPYGPPPYSYHDYGRPPNRQHPYEPVPYGHQEFYDQPQPRPLWEHGYSITHDRQYFEERSSRPEANARQTTRQIESLLDDASTTSAIPASSSAISEHAKFDLYMDDDFSDEDLCDEGDTADFIDKDTASIPDEGLNTEEILPEEFVSSTNELQCDFPMQDKNLVTSNLVSNQDRTVTLRRSIRKNMFMSIAFLFAMLLVRIPIISFLRDLASYYHLLARLVP
ncbi:hypothetical protein E4U49_000672 [Claviceps purpurea]|nr:hypothetical protein E4U49_000672 [Claviceps purpurea]